MNDLEQFNRLVGYWRARGLSEDAAHAQAELEMESHERNHDHESRYLRAV